MKHFIAALLTILFFMGISLSADSVHDNARNLYEQGEYQEAIALLEDLDPPLDYNKQYLLGLNYFRARQYHEAIEALSTLLDRTDEYPGAYFYLARCHLNTGELEEAKEHAQKSLTYFPNSDYSYIVLGIVLNQKGEEEEAREALEKAVELNPRNAWGRNNLGLLLMRKDYNEDALEHFKAAIEYDPDNAVYYNNLGITNERLGKYEQAVESYEKALELRPGFSRVENNLERVQDLLE